MGRTMTTTERERFLADLHVGVISIAQSGHGPLTIPIWYGYTSGGEVYIMTAKASRKARLLQRGDRISLCVQAEQRPYQYVSVEGPITSIEPVDVERDARPLYHRYLGIEAGDAHIARVAQSISGSEIVVRMRPERWLTGDYT
jgi:nitroimidazol reductase NimA-like FMN-containing flavoprotein (pyridoxamine 5'-phosphate oxidase superfamily)